MKHFRIRSEPYSDYSAFVAFILKGFVIPLFFEDRF